MHNIMNIAAVCFARSMILEVIQMKEHSYVLGSTRRSYMEDVSDEQGPPSKTLTLTKQTAIFPVDMIPQRS